MVREVWQTNHARVVCGTKWCEGVTNTWRYFALVVRNSSVGHHAVPNLRYILRGWERYASVFWGWIGRQTLHSGYEVGTFPRTPPSSSSPSPSITINHHHHHQSPPPPPPSSPSPPPSVIGRKDSSRHPTDVNAWEGERKGEREYVQHKCAKSQCLSIMV